MEENFMKKLIRAALCAALTALLTVPALAADRTPPAQQGDFNVLVNGKYVTFTDAVPQIKDARSCLPFVAVFEQLGFAEEDMKWDGGAKTVTAVKGEDTIALTIGEKTITLNGKAIAADVAPYIDAATNRTYVPFGLVADALGYNVGWDAQEKTVIIDDVDSILAANDAGYTLIDQYLDYQGGFYEKNQKVTGSYSFGFDMDMTVSGENSKVNMDMDGKYDMLTSGATAFQFNTGLTMDMTAEENGTKLTPEELGAELPMDMEMELRGDMEDGMVYFQSAALAKLMEQPDMASAWYKLDMKALFDEASDLLGMDYAALMDLSMSSLDKSFEETLSAVLKDLPLTSADMTTSDMLELYNAMVADSAFKKSGSSYVNTMEIPGLDGASMTLTLPTSGGKVNGCAMKMSMDIPEAGLMKLDYSMKDKKMAMTMEFGVKMDQSSMNMIMEMDGTYADTKESPVVQPPKSAVIVDMNQLMNGIE